MQIILQQKHEVETFDANRGEIRTIRLPSRVCVGDARSLLLKCILTLMPSFLILVIPNNHVHGQKINKITPADVYTQMLVVQEELDLIRKKMKKPVAGELPYKVKNAAPREVYFQAQSLFMEINRLSFEVTRKQLQLKKISHVDIRPSHVQKVVNMSLQQIRKVKKKLGINQRVPAPQHDPNRNASDVFMIIAKTNRQLNLLLKSQISHSDIYEQVTMAMGYVMRLQANFPGTRTPKTTAFEKNKKNQDVHKKILNCFQIIRVIAIQSEIEVLELEVNFDTHETVTAGDLYSLAFLVVSEVDYIYQKSKITKPVFGTYYPGVINHSQLYQRICILEAQLERLQLCVKNTPDWLTKKASQ